MTRTETAPAAAPAGFRRFWIYQRERFPLAAHGPLIACFSFCALSYSAQLRGARPGLAPVLVAFASCLCSFLHLRIADEFKDADEDRRFRPYRPVPRGLVKLRELGGIWFATAVLQAVLALALDVRLLGILLLTWAYLGLMTREFFVRAWLKARPVTYLWTHMLIMPLIDLYATSCDWVPAGTGLPRGLFWFLAVSFFNGVTIELGRKLRAPADEERGVETYTFLWGRPRAVGVWLGALFTTAAVALLAAHRIGFLVPAAVLLAAVPVLALAAGLRFLREPVTVRARRLETLTGLWTMILYLTLGAAPWAARALGFTP